MMAAAGLSDAENWQPRQSYAQGLKTWRSLWAAHFEAVVIACADESTASIIDRTVNTDIYMNVVQNLPVVPSHWQYHWNLSAMKLSTNPVFASVASKMVLQRQHGASFAVGSKSGSLRSKSGSLRRGTDSHGPRLSDSHGRRLSGGGGRRMSGAGMLMLQEALSGNERSAGAIIAKDPMLRSQQSSEKVQGADEDSGPQVDNLLEAEPAPIVLKATRRSSNASSAGVSPQGLAAGTERRRSSASIGLDGLPEDSKTHAERLVKRRLEDDKRNSQSDSMQQARASLTNVYKEEDVKAQANMSVAATAFQEFGSTKTEVMERPAQGMTLEKKRQIDSQAAIYEMPLELKDYIFKAIDKQLKYGNRDGVAVAGAVEDSHQHGDHDDEDGEGKEGENGKKEVAVPGAEEAHRVFEEVSKLAEMLNPMLINKRKESSVRSARQHRHQKKEELPPLTPR